MNISSRCVDRFCRGSKEAHLGESNRKSNVEAAEGLPVAPSPGHALFLELHHVSGRRDPLLLHLHHVAVQVLEADFEPGLSAQVRR